MTHGSSAHNVRSLKFLVLGRPSSHSLLSSELVWDGVGSGRSGWKSSRGKGMEVTQAK